MDEHSTIRWMTVSPPFLHHPDWPMQIGFSALSISHLTCRRHIHSRSSSNTPRQQQPTHHTTVAIPHHTTRYPFVTRLSVCSSFCLYLLATWLLCPSCISLLLLGPFFFVLLYRMGTRTVHTAPNSPASTAHQIFHLQPIHGLPFFCRQGCVDCRSTCT